jgi:hypothetical protein
MFTTTSKAPDEQGRQLFLLIVDERLSNWAQVTITSKLKKEKIKTQNFYK